MNNTSGESNAAVGNAALSLNTKGNFNTAIGWQAGIWGTQNTSSTYLGAEAFNADTNSQSYSTAVGHAARITADYQVRIGSTQTQSIGGFVNWSNLSDGRYKTNLREDVAGLDFILQLRPVTYYLDYAKLNRDLNIGINPPANMPDKDGKVSKTASSTPQSIEAIRYTGFIAQEVEEAALSAGFDFSGVDKPKNERDLYALRYAEFVVPLVKAVQEQQAQITEQQHRIEQLEQQIQSLLTRNGNPATGLSLRLSPNPAADVLQLRFQLDRNASVHYSITDAAGRTLRQTASGQLPSGAHQIAIDIHDLPAGDYFMHLYTSGQTETARFVVMRK